MGFDNECILNIQSLPGEYFCPVCRTLIFPNEALQSQCTHLYCKPCLAYIVATTHACPYDGYLVTEADSKPLLESNKSLAEAIGKVQVYCLYHRSGCQWQGTLSDCISHCTLCTFGNSPVVCNRCGTQIVHRQVQEHAQTCPGLQPQGQQVENAQVQALAVSNHGATQDASATALTTTSSTATVATTTIATTTSAVPAPTAPTVTAASAIDAVVQAQNPQVAVSYQQSGMQAPTAEQWYRQQLQYQQYYQQYPGYDPYQQQYQQYGQFQQQNYQQYPQTHLQVAPQQLIQGQQQAQQYVQSQPHVQPQLQHHSVSQTQQPQAGNQPQLHQQPVPQPQFQSQPQPQLLPHPQPQIQPQPQPSTQPLTHPQPQIQTQLMAHSQFSQAQHVPVQQTHQQVQPQIMPQATQLSAHPGQPHYHQLQPYPQAQQPVPHAQQHQPAVLSQQLPQPPMQQPPSQNQPRPLSLPQAQSYAQAQPQFQQPHIQQQPRPQPQLQPQTHHQPHPQAHPQTLPQPQPQPQPQNQSVHGVTGHQSYPQTPHQQIPHGMQQQRPMHQQQPGVPQQASQSQLPIQQPPQIWPPQTHMPAQTQQYPAMPPHAQAPHTNVASNPQSNHLVNQAGQQMNQPAGLQIPPQAFPQQQSLGHLQSAQLSQQGGFPSQPPTLSHSLRPQAQPYMQSQSNVPPAQGRSVATNQPMSQQVQHSPAKPIQAGFNQHSPHQNHLARQHGSIQQSQLNSGSQNSLVHTSRPGTDVYQISASGPDMKSTVFERPADSVLDKASQVKHLDTKAAGGNADGSEISRSSELIVSKPESDSKSLSEIETSNGDIKEISDTKENKDGLALKLEVAADFQDGQDVSNVSKDVEREKEVNQTEEKQSIILIPVVEGITGDSTTDGPNAVQTLPGNIKQTDKADQGYNSRNQLIGNPSSSLPSVQPIPHVQLQRDVETHDKDFPLPAYHDRSLTQFPPPQSGAVGLHGISPTGPLLGHERYPPQSFPHGHPSNMSDAAMASHKPSGPDRMFPQNISQAGSSHDRRFEEPFPHSIPGPPTAHGQLRPPGYTENFPYPVQTQVVAEPFQPPVAKQPYGSSRKVEEINPFPVRSQVHGPPPITVGPGGGQIDPLARSVMGGPGYYDGRQSESRGALPGEHVPFGQQTVVQPDMMKMNGLPVMGPAAAMHDSAFSHGAPDDRFRAPPGERFKSLPDESFRSAHGHFGPMMADSGLHIANRREYEEGSKLFPRPSNFDGDGAHRFNAYGSASGPLDRVHDTGSRPFDRPSMGTFPHPSSGRFPPSSGALGFAPLEDRQRGTLFHEDLGGKHEVHPERIRPFPEFGRPHFDTFPPIRSPGILDGSGHFRTEPAHFKKDVDPFDISHNRLRPTDPVGLGLSNNIKGVEPFSARTLPSHLRFNDPTSLAPLRGGEPFGFGGYGRTPIGDSGFSKSFSVHGSVSLHGDVDSFEHLRDRKNISCGWCRLCKIDCETVEGLEVHSQTKDHQNMAMEIVLNIKKENAKKQKLTSEESDDANKSWKMSFENRGGRH